MRGRAHCLPCKPPRGAAQHSNPGGISPGRASRARDSEGGGRGGQRVGTEQNRTEQNRPGEGGSRSLRVWFFNFAVMAAPALLFQRAPVSALSTVESRACASSASCASASGIAGRIGLAPARRPTSMSAACLRAASPRSLLLRVLADRLAVAVSSVSPRSFPSRFLSSFLCPDWEPLLADFIRGPSRFGPTLFCSLV